MTLRLDLYTAELRSLPHDLRWGWRQGGAAGAAAELRRRTLDQLHERGRLAVVEQDLERARPANAPRGVTLELLDASELHRLAALAPRRTLRALERRDGLRCFTARRGARVVGHECWSPALHPALDLLPVPLPDGTAFGHDLYVVPGERGRGIGSALAAVRLSDAREHGFRCLRRLIAPGNVASWRTAERSAAGRVVGEVWWVKRPGRLRTGFDPV